MFQLVLAALVVLLSVVPNGGVGNAQGNAAASLEYTKAPGIGCGGFSRDCRARINIGEGGTYKSAAGASVEQCAVICTDRSECMGFEYDHTTARCAFRSNTACNRVAAGAKDCYTKAGRGGTGFRRDPASRPQPRRHRHGRERPGPMPRSALPAADPMPAVGSPASTPGRNRLFDVNSVWPMPREMKDAGQRGRCATLAPLAELRLLLGLRGSSCCQEILEHAFTRLKTGALGATAGDPPHVIGGAGNTAGVTAECAAIGALTVTDIHVEVQESSELGVDTNESYTLQVAEESAGEFTALGAARLSGKAKVTILARSQYGALHALNTLGQLIKWTGKSHVLHGLPLVVNDRPSVRWRGLMVDTARHYIPLADLRRVINGMALLKLNVFHWHIVDRESFPFQSKTKPNFSKGAWSPLAVYTVKDVAELIEFAGRRGIRVVPEFDMPGHTGAWGLGYPEIMVQCKYKPDASFGNAMQMRPRGDQLALLPENFFWLIHPDSEDTFAFLDQFLTEVFALFKDKYFHFGGDEVLPGCWLQDPALAASGKRAPELQAAFMRRVIAMAKASNKTAIVWDECLGSNRNPISAENKLSKEVVVQVWRKWAGVTTPQAHSKGHRSVQSYTNFYSDNPSFKQMPTLPDLTVPKPQQTAPWWQIYSNQIDDRENPLTLGAEVCDWGEWRDGKTIDSRLFSGLAAAAENMWSDPGVTSPRKASVGIRYLGVKCHLMRASGINFANEIPDHCPPLRSAALPLDY